MVWLLLSVTISCSTRVHRPKPISLESCAEVQKKAQTRDQFFYALRGSATIYTKDLSVEIAAAFLKPEHARIEVKGPLGVSVALIQMDPQYLVLFIPREKSVYRFPTPELYKNNSRRDAFLALLPVPIYPDIFMEAILTLSQLPEKTQPCRYIEEENIYAFSVKDSTGEGGKWISLDPNSYFPLRVSYFDKKFPTSQKRADWRPTHELHFDKWDGSGLATIPTHISLHRGQERLFLFVWKDAESWKNYDEKTFEWRPSASVKIKDY